MEEKKDLIEFQKLGVNRISVGVQSLSPQTLKALDRIHSIDDVYRTLDILSELNFNFSVDFMLGLPAKQSGDRDIISEAKELLSFSPSHMSAYILTVNKNYIHYSALPDDNFISNEYLDLSQYMSSEGFLHYEVSNFAKHGAKSQHNLNYWKGNSVAALGPSATGFLGKNNDTGLRYKWKTVDQADYTVEELDHTQLKLEKFFLGFDFLTE